MMKAISARALVHPPAYKV